ncbi:MAG TPA: hypothetical protein DEQ14_03795 [Treponema sp.]|nr:hypothetical protein [Treponema sp.]
MDGFQLLYFLFDCGINYKTVVPRGGHVCMPEKFAYCRTTILPPYQAIFVILAAYFFRAFFFGRSITIYESSVTTRLKNGGD